MQATLSGGGRGGGTGTNLMQAMQQFMQTFSKSMSKMMEQVGQAQAVQTQAGTDQMSRVADQAERVFNQAEQKAETRRREERQDVLTEESREFSLDQVDYNALLQKQVSQDAKEVALLIQAEENAKLRIVEKRERDSAYISDARMSAQQWIDDTDASNGWDALPQGIELRSQMLDLMRMSEVVNEDFYNSPYSDKLHAMVARTQQAIAGGATEFESIVGTQPEPPMLPIPASMLETLGLDLPILSREEAREWRDRNGYPKGGVWAMKTDDPKRLLVNPVGFSALMTAKQHDTTLAIMGTKQAQKAFLMQQARKQREWDEYSKPLEDMAAELTKQYQTVMPEAVSSALRPAAMTAGLGGVDTEQGVDPMSMLQNFYSQAVRSPEKVARLMRLSLAEGDKDRWIPGAAAIGKKADPGQQAQDFYEVHQLGAAGDAMGDMLDKAHDNPAFRTNVAAWLGGMTEQQVWNVGLNEDVASAIANIKRGGVSSELAYGSAQTKLLMRRAVSQVISSWRATNRERFVVPLHNNNVMQVWRESNHAAAVLQDGTAVAILSRMDPEELRELGSTGKIPAGLLGEADRQRLFRAPVGILQSVVMLNANPGSRTAINEYTNGGPSKEEAEVFENPQYDAVSAYYQRVAKEGVFGPTSVHAPPGAPGRTFTQPYQSLTNLLHTSRAKAIMPPDPNAGGEGIEVAGPQAPPSAPGAPASAPPPSPSPGQAGPQFGAPQAPLGEPSQLGPQPVGTQGPTPQRVLGGP